MARRKWGVVTRPATSALKITPRLRRWQHAKHSLISLIVGQFFARRHIEVVTSQSDRRENGCPNVPSTSDWQTDFLYTTRRGLWKSSISRFFFKCPCIFFDNAVCIIPKWQLERSCWTAPNILLYVHFMKRSVVGLNKLNLNISSCSSATNKPAPDTRLTYSSVIPSIKIRIRPSTMGYRKGCVSTFNGSKRLD